MHMELQMVVRAVDGCPARPGAARVAGVFPAATLDFADWTRVER